MNPYPLGVSLMIWGGQLENWDFRLVDYWNQTTSAINRNTLRLSKLSEPARTAACEQIRDAVRMCVRDLADEQLLRAVVSMVDDLYKYVNEDVLMSAALFEYLDAFGRTLTQAVRERGYVIRYVVENQFSGVDFLMLGPFDVFPRVFNAAGFVYICPQQLGLQLMQHDGIMASKYPRAIAEYILEARHVSDRLVTTCRDEGRHYVFLEADYQEGALDIALRGRGAPGVLSIFRNEAPVAGSEVFVGFPEQKLRGSV
jgi:hypothetical protein